MSNLDFPKLISKHFNKEEIKTMGFRVGIDHEEADGESKQAKINYLIQQCQKHDKLGDLLGICIAERPRVKWPVLAELRITENDDLLAHPHVPIYKAWVVKQYNVMRLLSMERPLPLDAIYTDVYLLDKNRYWKNTTDNQANARLEAFSQRERGAFNERHSGVDMLAKEKHLFIVGQPGTGKTTFLKWLAVRAAQDELDLKKIPILVELRRLNDGQYSLFELIAKEWLDSGFPKALVYDYAEQLLRSGEALVLLDGLDEVPQELRGQVNNQIDDLLKMSGDSNVVLTCRPHAETRQFKSFIYMEMAEFTIEQTNKFIRNWFSKGSEKSKNLIQELENRDQKPIQELTKIPLLLVLICITYDQVGKLPPKRAELYSHALEVVLSKWDDERGVQRGSVYRQLTIKRKEELLAYVAYHTFNVGQIFIPQKELEKLITDFWQEWRQVEIAQQKAEYGQIIPQELPAKEIDPKQIIVEIVVQHGIFVEQAKDVYSFVHLSFQEYFTAKCIVNNASQGTVEKLFAYVQDDQWREVFLLTASLLDSATEISLLFVSCLNEISRESVLLTQLFEWAQAKALRVTQKINRSYRLVSLRVWFIDSATIRQIHKYSFLGHGHASILYLASEFDSEFDFDLELLELLASIQEGGKYTDFYLETVCKLSKQLKYAELHRKLSSLTIPDSLIKSGDLSEVTRTIENIISQNRDISGFIYLNKWTYEDHNNIQAIDWSELQAMDWSELQANGYLAYVKVIRLLFDCLSLATVNNRAMIENQLFLPSEVNEDEKLEKK